MIVPMSTESPYLREHPLVPKHSTVEYDSRNMTYTIWPPNGRPFKVTAEEFNSVSYNSGEHNMPNIDGVLRHLAQIGRGVRSCARTVR